MPHNALITPVLLSGGSGTRLWPLSRKCYPKQFVPLMGDKTMFQESAMRLAGQDYAAPLVMTNADFRFIVTEQLLEIGIHPSAILIEPEGRNTAPAILAAALWLEQQDPDSVMLVAPSDHVVPDAKAFREAVACGLEAAKNGQLVTFGIKPTYPETGYGYLELSKSFQDCRDVAPLSRFIEKPDKASAEAMIASPRYLWNAGIFLFTAKAILAAFKANCPELMEPVVQAVDHGKPDLGFLRLDPEAWRRAKDISIDYAVMEKAQNLSVVPFSAGWSDLGGWDAVWRESSKDQRNVAVSGPATAIDCDDTLLRSEDDAVALVGIGLDHVMAVATSDAVLVADMTRAQDVRQAVDLLRAKQVSQADKAPIDHRPWGWAETLALAERFQVKRIVVKPGGALSLQSHFHRSEHWIVVAGTAKVTIGEDVQLVTENQSVYIPIGARHRLENPGHVPMVLIEVQTGAYLGDDDIIRYDDVYARD